MPAMRSATTMGIDTACRRAATMRPGSKPPSELDPRARALLAAGATKDQARVRGS